MNSVRNSKQLFHILKIKFKTVNNSREFGLEYVYGYVVGFIHELHSCVGIGSTSPRHHFPFNEFSFPSMNLSAYAFVRSPDANN